MYILDPTLDDAATEGLIGQIEEFIVKQEAVLDKTERWGRRRLAYNIARRQEGYYVLSQLKASAIAVSEIGRRLRVTDGVLRYMTVRTDEDLAKIERRRARNAVQVEARRARRAAAGREKPIDPEKSFASAPESPSAEVESEEEL
jgi:small subunit ribosomal protein S6